jgi:hypothetical protein
VEEGVFLFFTKALLFFGKAGQKRRFVLLRYTFLIVILQHRTVEEVVNNYHLFLVLVRMNIRLKCLLLSIIL